MQWSDFLAHGTWVLFGVAALTLFAVGEVLGRQRRRAPARIGSRNQMMALLDAASAVCEMASGERLPIVVAARRADEKLSAHDWFARSLATVVPLYRMVDGNVFEKLDGPVDIGTEFRSLYIRKQDIRSYMRWARTLQ